MLYSPVNGGVGVALPNISPGEFLSESMPLCIDEAGTVTITRVEPIDPADELSILDFAVRTTHPGATPLGAAQGDLSAMGLTPKEQAVHEVTNVCNELLRANVGLEGAPPDGTPDPRVDLVIAFSATAVPAHTEAIRIYYSTASGEERSTTSPLTIDLCEGKVSDFGCPRSG